APARAWQLEALFGEHARSLSRGLAARLPRHLRPLSDQPEAQGRQRPGAGAQHRRDLRRRLAAGLAIGKHRAGQVRHQLFPGRPPAVGGPARLQRRRDGVDHQHLSLPGHPADHEHAGDAPHPAKGGGRIRAVLDLLRLPGRRPADDRLPAEAGQPRRAGRPDLDGGQRGDRADPARHRARRARGLLPGIRRAARRPRPGPPGRGHDPGVLALLPRPDGPRMTGMGNKHYDAKRALEYRYARLLDEDRLEEWPNLFVERGVYKVIPRENLDRQPPLPIMFCDSRAMMLDRVVSLRKANVYNLHSSRHVVSNIEILSARDDTYEVAACYTVYQTDLEGQTRLFSVGQYRDVIANGAGELRFREKIAVCDTFNIPNLLAIPL